MSAAIGSNSCHCPMTENGSNFFDILSYKISDEHGIFGSAELQKSLKVLEESAINKYVPPHHKNLLGKTQSKKETTNIKDIKNNDAFRYSSPFYHSCVCGHSINYRQYQEPKKYGGVPIKLKTPAVVVKLRY